MKGRLEDGRMLTGRGRYVSDWNLPGQAHGVFLRSDRPHAKIVSIDKAEALRQPGVVAVITGAELALAGLKPIPAAAPFKWKDGSDQRQAQRLSLAHEVVRHVGEPVALIVAETAAQAQDASESVVIDYEDLPAVVTAQEAMAPGAPQLHSGAAGNLVLDFVGGDEAATNAAFAKATKVVKVTAYHSRVIGNPMEPRAAMGSYDAAKDLYFLHATTQGVGPMRGQLSAVLGVPPEKVRVVAEEVGGGFGVRFNAYPEYGALLYAGKKLGRPVKWVGTRSEVFLGDEQARDIEHTAEMALDASGRILGMRFDYLSNMGAYVVFTGSVVNTLGLVNVNCGVYDVQAVHVRGRLVLTNTVPTAAYRGAGRPVASYALERLVDEAARELGMDPAEFRRRNMIPPAKMPYKLVGGFEYDSGDFEAVMNKALAASQWNSFSKRKEDSKKKNRLRGRGMATYIEMTAPGGFAPHDQALINWEKDGTLTLRTASHNHGQGHETTFAQIVSRVLGIPVERIRLRTSEPEYNLVANPTGGSRTLHGLGSAMHWASQEIVKNGIDLAAEHLESAAQDIEFETGDYRIKGTDRKVRIDELAKRYPGKLDLDFIGRPKVGATYPNGCHIAEVEIDPETGECDIVSYVACDDVGTIINHQIVEGQMQGGVTQGAGHIFLEQGIYDSSGQLLTGSFMDYAMPRAGLVGGLTVTDHAVPTATNPLGAKGVGEGGVTGSMPALMNAVMDALRSAGVKHFDMPASPRRLWQALQGEVTRILTTHVGSLIRPPELLKFIAAKQGGLAYDTQGYEECLARTVKEVVKQQAAIGIDLPSDGEFGKSISWSQYALERLSGFERRKAQPGSNPFQRGADRTRFAEFYAEMDRADGAPTTAAQAGAPIAVCVGPITYTGQAEIQRDIAHFKAALDAAGVAQGFLPVAAPSSVIPDRKNEYYKSEDECLEAIARAMRTEYKAIIDAGLLLQLDDARFAVTYDRMVPPASLADYRNWVARHVEVLNAALEGIPEDRVRYHVCWGSWPGPHVTDVPLKDVVDLILKVRAGAYLIEGANPRHEHEWRVWEKTKLPAGRKLVPGVISHATNIVEHPELVAQRLVRLARVIGPENVMAGTDCGFAQGPFHRRVHPSILWAKLEALVEGAKLASREL